MFKKGTRKTLLDPKQLVFKTPNMSNPSKTWRDYKRITNTAINDMILLYQKLDLEKRNELYNLNNFKRFFDILLKPDFDKSDNIVKLEMANHIIEKSIIIFKEKHKQQNQNTQILASIVIDYLDKASEICRDITYKEKMSNTDLVIPKEELISFGWWNELVKRDKINIENFLGDLWLIIPDGEINLRRHSNTEIIGNFTDFITKAAYNIEFTLNGARDKANLSVYNKNGFNENVQFIVKPKHEDYLLYYVESAIEKIKAKLFIKD